LKYKKVEEEFLQLRNDGKLELENFRSEKLETRLHKLAEHLKDNTDNQVWCIRKFTSI